MLNHAGIFVSSFIIAFSGAIMPGPLLTATVAEAPGKGFMAGFLLISGHGILELALIVALLSGLAPYLSGRLAFMIISLVGSCFLIYMAIGMFRGLSSLTLNQPKDAKKGKNLLITGALLSILNPYWSIWWATIGMGYLLAARQSGIWGILFFFLGHLLADFLWYCSVAAGIYKGREFLTDRLYRRLVAFCAACLIFFAGYFIRSAF